jgi:hypothetical protein
VSRRGARAHTLFARAFFSLAATGLVFGGFVACRSDPVVIGIEIDGGPIQVKGPPPPIGRDADIAPDASWAIGDAGFADADEGQCLPDAGCPPASICYYLVLEAGCPLPGECFASGGPAVPPPPPAPERGPLGAGPAGERSAEPERVPRVFDAPYGYTSVRPDCGVSDPSAPLQVDSGIP